MLPWPAGQFYQLPAKAYTLWAIMVQAAEQAVQDNMTQRGITPSFLGPRAYDTEVMFRVP
jgi:hypothetical protein